MNKIFKKFLSLLLVCSIIFTTHSFTTFADAFNNEETESYIGANSPEAHNREVSPEEETTIEEESTTEEETTIETVEENSESEDDETTEETTIEEETTTEEETTENNVGANSPEAHNREVSPEEETTEESSDEYIEEPELDEVKITDGETTTEEETSVEEEISATEETTTEELITLKEKFSIDEIETDTEKKVEDPILATENMKFSFAFGSDHTFGSFDKAGNKYSVEFNSSELPGKPVTIPPIYYKKLKNPGHPQFRFLWKDNGGAVYEDGEMETIIQNWMQNPDMDRTYYVSNYEVDVIDIESNPTKLTYDIGDTVDPSGLVLRLRNTSIGRSELASYDSTEYKDIITYELINMSHQKMEGKTITADTFSIRFRFNNSIAYKDVEITVNPCTFTFNVSDNLGLFNAADGPSTIEFKSDELATKPVEIPVVYLKEIASGDCSVNVGWKNHTDGDKKITDTQLNKIVSDWSKGPNKNIEITVNFETVNKSRVKTQPKVDYFIGDTFDPSGLVIEVSNSSRSWTKDIPYDKPEFQRLYSYKLYDKDNQEISGTTITGSTKYCKFQYNSSVNENVNINVTKRVTEISVVHEQDYKMYSTGEKFDPKGLVIKVKYDDDSEEEVPYESKKTSFTFDPTTITSGISQVNVNYGGKTTTTSVTIVDNKFVLYCYDDSNDSVNIFHASTGEEANVESALDDAESLGATGFYKISASGCYNGSKKYKKNNNYSLTIDQALDIYKNNYDGTSSVYIGASFYTPSPSQGGDDSGGGSGGPAGGPISVRSSNNIPNTNSIPQSNLVVDTQLAYNLLSYPTNENRSVSKVVDRSGNEGFGRWLQVPNTKEWYFLSGEISSDGSKGTCGFISSGFYNLDWSGQDAWYYFNEDGSMRVGWYQENGNTYFLQNDFSDSMYGRVLTGIQTIEGKTYNFGNDGVLIK